MNKRLISILSAAAVVLTGFARETNIMNAVDKAACDRWVDSVYNSLTERERVAQLIVPKAVPTHGEKSKERLKQLVENVGVGGLLFTAGSLEQYVEMTNYAQSLA